MLGRMVLPFIRFWLPVGLMAAGVLVAIAGGLDRDAFEVGTPIFSAGLVILAVNFLLRLSIGEEADRERDELRRNYFVEHGHWPDEPPR